MSNRQVYFKNIHGSVKVGPGLYKILRSVSREVLGAEKCTDYEVTMVFVDNQYIKNLNGQYRKKNTATDVLAFGFYRDPQTRADYGDIYISLDKVRTQARQYRVLFNRELLRLALHGLLHLCGHHHRLKKEKQVMEQKLEFWLSQVKNNGKG